MDIMGPHSSKLIAVTLHPLLKRLELLLSDNCLDSI